MRQQYIGTGSEGKYVQLFTTKNKLSFRAISILMLSRKELRTKLIKCVIIIAFDCLTMKQQDENINNVSRRIVTNAVIAIAVHVLI